MHRLGRQPRQPVVVQVPPPREKREAEPHRPKAQQAPKTPKRRRVTPAAVVESPEGTSDDVMPEIVADMDSRVTQHRVDQYAAIRQSAEKIVARVDELGNGTVARPPEQLVRMTSFEGMRELTRILSKHPHDTLSQGFADRALVRRGITMVTREWEAQFMREPQGGSERPCANSLVRDKCFASRLRANGLVDATFRMVEFYDKQTYEVLRQRKWQWPDGPPNLCILCLHEQVCCEFIRNRSRRVSLRPNVSCSTIGNITDQPGEYRLQDTLVNSTGCNEGLVVPVAMFLPDAFTVTSVRGVRHLHLNLPTPETQHHFCLASSDSAQC
jgi:hypothetical protein